MDMSFRSERLKTSSLPSLLIGVSAGASAVATPPPFSPLLVRLLLFAISVLSCAARDSPHAGFRVSASCQMICTMPVKRESFLADRGAVRGGLLSRCLTHYLSNLAARGRNPEERGIIAYLDAGRLGKCGLGSDSRFKPGPDVSLTQVRCLLTQGFLILNESWRIASDNLP